MISQILYNTIPHQYKTAIAIIKRDIDKGIEITLDSVKEDLRGIYATIKQTNTTKRQQETALVGKHKFKKQFKGLCRLCGKIGHKAADCWTNEANKHKRPKNYKGKGSKPETANVTSTTTKKKETCAHCHKPGHNIKDCWKKKSEDAKPKPDTTPSTDSSRAAVMMIAVSRTEFEVLLSNNTGTYQMTNNTFICDSGASCHMRNSTDGMFELVDHIQAITVGNSETMYSSYMGKFKGTIIQQDGTNIDIVLHDVLYVPDLWVNLISVTKALKYPQTKLTSKGELIAIDYKDQVNQTVQTIVFDKIFTTGNGQLLGIEIKPEKEYGNILLLSKTLLKYEDIHGKLGHPNDQVVKQTAKYYGSSIEEPTNTCNSVQQLNTRNPQYLKQQTDR